MTRQPPSTSEILEAAVSGSGELPLTQDFTPAFFANLAKRLEEAAAAPSPAGLAELAVQLHAVAWSFARQGPSEVMRAFKGDAGAYPEILLAFRLGQLSFAQLFAAQTAEERGASIHGGARG
jgi:hypothetical protein